MPDDIQDLERTIEADRGMLDSALSQLSQALSAEKLSETVSREIQNRSGTIGQTALDAARANPAAAVLVGAGIAALLAGPKKPNAKAGAEPPYDSRKGERVKTQLRDDVLTSEFDRRVRAADDTLPNEPSAPKMRAALNNGLANLPEPARKRVLKAREAAIAVQERLDQKASIAARKAQSFHHRQPLSTGALAVGLGAIVASLLPRTKMEDEYLGPKRDALLQQAEFALRDEIATAARTGEAAMRDGIEAGYTRLRS